MTKEIKRKFIELGLGTAIYLYALYLCEFQGNMGTAGIIVYMIAWVVLMLGVCRDMITNIRKMQFFDENLLILVATIGALVIGRYVEAVGAVLFFQIGKMIEAIAVNRAKKSIAKFMNIRPEFANLKTEEGTEMIVHPMELKIGQTIVIKPGEKIPVDAVITEGKGMVDMKVLTGETMPKELCPGKKVYSGTINLNSVLEARVEKVYAESTASKVTRLVEEASQRRSVSEGVAEKFRRYYTPIVTILGVLLMILPPMLVDGHNSEVWLYRGMVFLVSACPIGLGVSVPLAFLGGIGSASRQGILIKGSDHLEALALAETFVFDKTGTLTEGVFRVQQVVPAVSEGFSEKELLMITAKAEAYSSHPIAVSLRKAFDKEIDLTSIEQVEEHSGFGVSALVDGQKVYVGNAKLMKKFAIVHPFIEATGTVVYVAVEETYAGYIVIGDQIRADAKRLVCWLHKNQMETVILTGDNKKMAKATAKKLGIRSVLAELMPEDKVEQLELFMDSQRENEKLVFVGDGINDAPVLARADVGIAMGGLGADAALEAADIVLLKDQPSRIINAVRIAKATLKVVKQNMIFAIGMKIFMLCLALFGLLNMQNAIIADMCVMLINILNSFWVLKYPEYKGESL